MKLIKIDKSSLNDTGRLQFFFHSPSSKLPIRDILNEQKQGHKTEPHIEIGAENYINCCYQGNNIKPFSNNNEKYLFLFTNCKSKQLNEYYGKRYIVGYIEKEFRVECSGHCAVKGCVNIFSFEDSYPLSHLDLPGENKATHIRVKRIYKDDAQSILETFKGKRNIIKECIEEIKRLDELNRIEDKTCKVLKGEKCRFQTECLRWNI